MKRAYYVHYYRNFGNTYNLYWALGGEAVPANWERITRKAAISLCIRERDARRQDPAFSGYGDTRIYPAAWASVDPYTVPCGPYTMDGPYIVEGAAND